MHLAHKTIYLFSLSKLCTLTLASCMECFKSAFCFSTSAIFCLSWFVTKGCMIGRRKILPHDAMSPSWLSAEPSLLLLLSPTSPFSLPPPPLYQLCISQRRISLQAYESFQPALLAFPGPSLCFELPRKIHQLVWWPSPNLQSMNVQRIRRQKAISGCGSACQ